MSTHLKHILAFTGGLCIAAPLNAATHKEYKDLVAAHGKILNATLIAAEDANYEPGVELAAKKKKGEGDESLPEDGSQPAGGEAKIEPPNPIWYVMPLGAGQFVNGRPILGSVFAAGQVAGFVMGLMFYLESEAVFTEYEKYKKTITDKTNKDSATVQNEKFKKAQADQDSATTMSYVGYGIAGASYLGSVIEAFVSGPAQPEGPVKKKKKKKKKKDALSIDDFSDHEVYEFSQVKPYLDWHVVPAPHTLALNVSYHF